jgi:hypothetical protein
MSTYDESRLAARFAALAPEPLAGDWEDVRARVGTAQKRRPRFAGTRWSPRRRLVVFAAVVFVILAGTASAFAVHTILATRGIVGLAPAGATPSTPTNGELVVGFSFGHSWSDAGRLDVSVYADGRVIWQRLGNFSARLEELSAPTGLLERRLTPEGVKLVKAEVLATGLVEHDLLLASGQGLINGFLDFRTGDRRVFVAWGDAFTWDGVSPYVWRRQATPEQASALIQLDERLADLGSWLPASAWQDSEARAYVPPGYSVCYDGQKGIGRRGVLALLPSAAENLLRTKDVTPSEHASPLGGTSVSWCSQVTNAEARTLERVLDEAGVRGIEDVFGLEYGVPARPRPTTAADFSVRLHPLLPDQVGVSKGGAR